MSQVKADRVVDARGTACPGPLMEAVRIIKKMNIGEVVEILSTDPGSKNDIPAWAKKAGQEIVAIIEEQGYWRIFLKKVK
ncbi:MAG: sulfurtransferase TusA family protein [Thermoprotei archaeon]